MNPANPWSTLLMQPRKPRVFVSYHHRNDQKWCDYFIQKFSEEFELFTDTSVEHEIDSDDSEYQSRYIREQHISGSGATVVLCGSETWKRKHVDWEIHATLEKKHALLGIILPAHIKNTAGQIIVPDRFNDNVQSGYAAWMHWSYQPNDVVAGIRRALALAQNTNVIANWREQMGKNIT